MEDRLKELEIRLARAERALGTVRRREHLYGALLLTLVAAATVAMIAKPAIPAAPPPGALTAPFTVVDPATNAILFQVSPATRTNRGLLPPRVLIGTSLAVASPRRPPAREVLLLEFSNPAGTSQESALTLYDRQGVPSVTIGTKKQPNGSLFKGVAVHAAERSARPWISAFLGSASDQSPRVSFTNPRTKAEASNLGWDSLTFSEQKTLTDPQSQQRFTRNFVAADLNRDRLVFLKPALRNGRPTQSPVKNYGRE